MKKSKILAVLALIALTGFLWIGCKEDDSSPTGGGTKPGAVGGSDLSTGPGIEGITYSPVAAKAGIFYDIGKNSGATRGTNGTADTTELVITFYNKEATADKIPANQTNVPQLALSDITVSAGTGEVTKVSVAPIVPAPTPAYSQYVLTITTQVPGSIKVSINKSVSGVPVETTTKTLTVFKNGAQLAVINSTAASETGTDGKDGEKNATYIDLTFDMPVYGLALADIVITPDTDTGVAGTDGKATVTKVTMGADPKKWTVDVKDVSQGNINIAITKAGVSPDKKAYKVFGLLPEKVESKLTNSGTPTVGVPFNITLTAKNGTAPEKTFNGKKNVAYATLVVAGDTTSFGTVNNAVKADGTIGKVNLADTGNFDVMFTQGEAIVSITLAKAINAGPLTLTVTGPVATSANFASVTVAPGAVAKLKFGSLTPTFPTIGGTDRPFGNDITVTLYDAYGNIVITDWMPEPPPPPTVTLGIYSTTLGTATISGGATVEADISTGIATFPAATTLISNSARVEGIRLKATSGSATTDGMNFASPPVADANYGPTTATGVYINQPPVSFTIAPYPDDVAAPTIGVKINFSSPLHYTTAFDDSKISVTDANGWDKAASNPLSASTGGRRQEYILYLDEGSGNSNLTVTITLAGEIVTTASNSVAVKATP